MSVSQPLFACLDKLGIAHSTIEHEPVFTVEDGRDWKHEIPRPALQEPVHEGRQGPHRARGAAGRQARRHQGNEKKAGLGRLSFGKPDLLKQALGVEPGSVTPFALINDRERRVLVILDADMMQAETVNYHPLRNDASTTIRAEDLMKFVRALGYQPLVFDCG